MDIPKFDSSSRLMLFAPHPDDESLACGLVIQSAVRAGAAVRVVYVTDGENNPWPQRFLERKWHLDEAARKRWGKLRRTEALAALRILGVSAQSTLFLGLPDQHLTDLLLCDCRSLLKDFASLIAEWSPTDLFVPSASDTHPDHNAAAVMLRLAVAALGRKNHSIWSYIVHGRSATFFARAAEIPHNRTHTARKKAAICCQKTQLSLSKYRFLQYAARPERFVKLDQPEEDRAAGPIRSVSLRNEAIYVTIQFAINPFRSRQATLLLFGRDRFGTPCAAEMPLADRPAKIDIVDRITSRRLGAGQYEGNAITGRITLPAAMFCTDHPLFVKVKRNSLFFDEMGWLEIPAIAPVVDTLVASNWQPARTDVVGVR